MNIVFMGTPDFAVSVLRRVAEAGYGVLCAVSQPDRPRNRGMKLVPTPVKAYALSRGIPVYQPERCRDGEAVGRIRSLRPDAILVAAYGQILPQALLDVPGAAVINVHSSLLPQYRGAAPINRAILNGDAETGVTVQYMARELDAGDILLQKRTAIGPEEDAVELYGRLSELGGEAAVEALELLESGSAPRTPQVYGPRYQYAPLLSRDMSPLDWSRSARALHDQVRGLVPWPCATMELGGRTIKVFRSLVGGATRAEPGTVVSADGDGVAVACGDARTLIVTELQAPGARRMAAADFLRGHRL